MVHFRHEYHSLECKKQFVRYKFVSKILIYCLLIIQFMILLSWLSTLIEMKKGNNENVHWYSDKNNLQNEKKFVIRTEWFEETNHMDNNFYWDFTTDNVCELLNDDQKFDCHPEPDSNEQLCRKRGCCWMSSSHKNVPSCFYKKPYNGYEIVNITSTKAGITAFLNRTYPSPYPDDIKLLRMSILYLSNYSVRIKIEDANSDRYEPPYPEIPTVFKHDALKPDYKVIPNPNGFRVYRSDGVILFDSKNIGGFIFADQYLQISAQFQGKIYGLGEHESSFRLNTSWTKFTMFSHDGVPTPNANLYGSHPFYLVLEPSGKSHGVFLHNSNAMEVILQPLPAITFRAIGGIFDFYFFLGPTPADVVKQYSDIIGHPFFPPYWSLGFHLSRLGYKNTEHIRYVWNRTRAANIPFDTQWHDIDYMDKKNDFTYDKANYLKLPEFVDDLHREGMRYVPILDPGISGCEPDGTYRPYEDGLISNAFIKNNDGTIFVGKVWNSNCTVFPDFTSPNTVLFWFRQIEKFHSQIPFDGLWIDMNEPSNFLDGGKSGCPLNKWEQPPYLPEVCGGKLFDKTICMSTRQYYGWHYDLHNLYGISEAKATHRALMQLGKRPFIISRSTYPGSGRFAGHWSGDISSTWQAMKRSIPQMLSFSLFNVPMMGADICGFNGNTTAMLCQRWSQLGAFYPFSRNHNTDDAIDQDPAAFGANIADSTKKALMIRYSLLPYLYTLFFKAHTEGETVARPLFFEFTDDPKTHDVDQSFLWGCCILIVPITEELATTVTTYLPNARWYDWYTEMGTDSNGTEVVLHAASDVIPIFIRGGSIIPIQIPDVTTSLSRLNNFELIAAFNQSMHGSGSLYWDDGESMDTFNTKKFGIVEFCLSPTNLTSSVIHWGYDKHPTLQTIKILGFFKPIKKIFFNKKAIPFNWNQTSLVLTVKMQHPINLSFTLVWKFMG